jgi:hypothetical protein
MPDTHPSLRIPDQARRGSETWIFFTSKSDI